MSDAKKKQLNEIEKTEKPKFGRAELTVVSGDNPGRFGVAYEKVIKAKPPFEPSDAASREFLGVVRGLSLADVGALLGQWRDNPTHFDRSDLGAAFRVMSVFSGRLLYVVDIDRFAVWDGRRFQLDSQGSRPLANFAVQTASRVVEVEAATSSDEEMADMFKFTRMLRSARGAKSVISCIQAQTQVTSSEFDKDVEAINTPAGVFDPRVGETLRPARPEDRMTKMTPVAPDFSMKTPAWDRFIADFACADDSLVDYIQMMLGYVVTGGNKEHLIVIVKGEAGCGKGVIFGLIQRLIGSDYYCVASPSILNDQTPPGAARPHIVALAGKRLISMTEPNDGLVINGGDIKRLASNDKSDARQVYSPQGEVDVVGTICVQMNDGTELKLIGAVDNAIKRRIVTIPASHKPTAADPYLMDKLFADEGPGILAWILRGGLKYRQFESMKEVPRPDCVKQATTLFLGELDELHGFASCVVQRDGNVIRAGDFNAAYEAYCRAIGKRPCGMTKFGTLIKVAPGLKDFMVSDRDRHGALYRNVMVSPQAPSAGRPAGTAPEATDSSEGLSSRSAGLGVRRRWRADIDG